MQTFEHSSEQVGINLSFTNHCKNIKEKGCGSGFPYCFLTNFTNVFLRRSMLLDFGFLTEEASWIHRIFKIWSNDKKHKKIQIRLKFKGLDRFSQDLVSNITQSYCIYAQNLSSLNRSLPESDNFEKILKKFKISKNLNASIDFGQIQYQSSLIDIILCEVSV